MCKTCETPSESRFCRFCRFCTPAFSIFSLNRVGCIQRFGVDAVAYRGSSACSPFGFFNGGYPVVFRQKVASLFYFISSLESDPSVASVNIPMREAFGYFAFSNLGDQGLR